MRLFLTTLFLLLFVVNSPTAFSQNLFGPFTLESQVDQQVVIINISTITINSITCTPNIAALSIQLPTTESSGRIEIITGDLTDAYCMDSFGTHTITMELPRGETLPFIPNGEYEVYLNNEYVDSVTLLGRGGQETGNGMTPIP
jgi:hypothetical protein